MNRSISAFLFCIVLLVPDYALASDVSVTLSCPSFVHYGTGTTILTVTARLESGYDAIALQRYAVSMIANGNSTVTGARIYGPFAKMRSTPINLGSYATMTVNVPTMTVPNLVGRMAFVAVEFITGTGRSVGGDGCWVNILV